jgi:hypothetical protein
MVSAVSFRSFRFDVSLYLEFFIFIQNYSWQNYSCLYGLKYFEGLSRMLSSLVICNISTNILVI